MRAAAEEAHKPTRIGKRKGSRKGSVPQYICWYLKIRYVSVFDRHQVFPRLERFNATSWKEAAVRLTYSESQGSNPILRLRHAQILLFTPFFLRNICNGGWIWLLWNETVATTCIKISLHLSLEVEGFNLYNLKTYCESSTPLVKSIPDLSSKRGWRKGKWIGYNKSWRGYILTQILKLCWTDFSKGGVGLGSDPYNFLAIAYPHFF